MNRKPIESLPPQKYVDAETGEDIKRTGTVVVHQTAIADRPLVERLAPIMEALGKEPGRYRFQYLDFRKEWAETDFPSMIEMAGRGGAVRIVPDVPTMTATIPVPDNIEHGVVALSGDGVIELVFSEPGDKSEALNAILKAAKEAKRQ